MKAAPNSTVVHGILRSAEAAADGFGGHVEIDVVDNASPDPATDFLRPEPGKPLRAFYGALDAATGKMVGRRVRAELTLNAGPSGGQAVVRDLVAD